VEGLVVLELVVGFFEVVVVVVRMGGG